MYAEVSVIIPTYNRRVMVCEAVASVLAQHGAPPAVTCEVIVVDDGSTDGTGEELNRVAAKVNARAAESVCLGLRVLRTENRGVAAARNAGAASASAPLIAFLDSDDLWLPDKLARHLAFMRQHPEYAIAQTEELWLRGGRRVNPGRRHRKRGGDFFIDSLRTCLISPSAVMLRTALFHEVGGFDERMMAAEDYDLWLRILAGREVGLLAEPLVMRRAGHPGQLSATIPAIDRFRIVALLKLLMVNGMTELRRRAVAEVLSEKCAIYAEGLRRRGRDTDAKVVAAISARAKTFGEKPQPTALDESIASLITIISKASELNTNACGETKDALETSHEPSGVTHEGRAKVREAAA
jgi:glycosyltransferase involved in cell wall biosynthesis